ncbi:hypothetical protein RM780_07735 [Streptomyces sp. DSM 44917]|uniref:Zinc finger CGNR domain-containing protein n=1 Tax=Streptomyces boetiae TaxID=3075541 RepID=A0ABU2L6A2_9ACTN|nr:hypothetical protein [Streptomyces sp. DSM 44917]MDT0306853.1 hypothetical protein [Streptomyces sp. DSM 44917]
MTATSPTSTDPAATHLQLLLDHWPDLEDALTARQATDWPPSMGIQRLREPDETGDGRVGDVQRLPIRADVFDAMQEITRALVDLADQIAAEIQRPPAAPFRPASSLDETGRRLAALAGHDAADARRWRYTGQRTATQAATWLNARYTNQPGPAAPLRDAHRTAIADVAAACAVTTTRLLRTARLTTPTGRQHDGCGGQLIVSGGDGQMPAVECDRCHRTWKPGTIPNRH